jgi:hypothetical protein
MTRGLLLLLSVLGLSGCPEEPAPPPPAPPPPAAKPPRPAPADAGTTDAGAPDAGASDGGDALDGGEDGGAPVDAWVEVRSTPPGADITVDGAHVGTSPQTVPLQSGKSHLVGLTLSGRVAQTREVQPAPGETASVDVALEPGATLQVTSDPPDASVSVNGQLVLEATPGVTAPFRPGTVEVSVALPGFDTYKKKLKARGEQKLTVKLRPAVMVHVTSKPPEAEVLLDGEKQGVTPVDLRLSSKGTYTVVVTKEGWSTVKKVLRKPKGGPLDVRLSDLELDHLAAEAEKALKAYDRAYEALAHAQDLAKEDPAQEPQVDAAEDKMTEATTALEEAQRALEAAKARRAR